MNEIKLGQKAKQGVTGFTGIITARVEYLSGLIQYQITAESVENKKAEEEWFLPTEIEILED